VRNGSPREHFSDFIGVDVVRADLKSFLKLLFRHRVVVCLLVGNAEVVVECGILRVRADGFLQSIDGGTVCALIVVRPAEHVGGVRKIGQTSASGLGERKSDVDVAAVFERQIGKVVGRQRIIGLNLQRFLILVFRLLPLARSRSVSSMISINPGESWFPISSTGRKRGELLVLVSANYDYQQITRGQLTNPALIAMNAGSLGIKVITANARDFGKLAEFRSFPW
jgi:hypothetical protein